MNERALSVHPRALEGAVKRRLFLHLGLWKTGTTTIQSFLRGNPGVLADLGVHYPRVGPENPDHPYFNPKPPTHFLADEVSHQYLARELAGRKHNPPVDPPLWSTAFRLIDSSGAHTAIISYEDFSAQVPLYDFGVISEPLKAFEFVGIIYLRPQESWAISLYSHFVRGARTSLTFEDFVEGIRHRLTYSVLLDQIMKQIPLDRLIVRNFDEASKIDLLSDFFQSLDLPDALSASGKDHEARNRSLPYWAVLFLLKCVQASFPTEQLAEVRRALIQRAKGRRSLPLEPGLDVASPAERTGLRRIMNADAERLAERYGIKFPAPEPTTTSYRPFDRNDFDAIRAAIKPRLTTHTLAALGNL